MHSSAVFQLGGSGAGILNHNDFIVPIMRVTGGRLNGPCCTDTGKDNALDLSSC